MRLYPGEHIIDDGNYHKHIDPLVDGQRVHRGCVPRDFNALPPGCYRGTMTDVPMALIPRSEWSARIKEQEQTRSRSSDLILSANIPSLDQNGKGYCWAHSSTGALIALRCAQHIPYVPLSAYAVACTIKNFRDEGGWGALAMDFLMQRGVPSEKFWPAQSMSRSNDNPQTWADAALHKVTDGFIDFASAVYDRNLTFDQMATLLLCRVPVVIDLNWWGHSVYAVDLVEVSANAYGVRFRNSWGNSYGSKGFSILQGSKAIPDGAVAPWIATAA